MAARTASTQAGFTASRALSENADESNEGRTVDPILNQRQKPVTRQMLLQRYGVAPAGGVGFKFQANRFAIAQIIVGIPSIFKEDVKKHWFY